MTDAIERRVILDFHYHVLTDDRKQWEAFLARPDVEDLRIALEIWDREWPEQGRKKGMLQGEIARREEPRPPLPDAMAQIVESTRSMTELIGEATRAQKALQIDPSELDPMMTASEPARGGADAEEVEDARTGSPEPLREQGRVQEVARKAQEPNWLVAFWRDHWNWIITTILTVIGLYIAGVAAGII